MSRAQGAMVAGVSTLVVTASLLVLSGCTGSKASTAAVIAEERPRVELVTIAVRAEEGYIRASGLTGYKRELALGFKVGGVIERIATDAGQRVAAGQILASLKPVEVAAANQEAEAALARAETDLARNQALFDKGFVAQARLDDAKLAVERAKAARAARNFDRSTSIITAPAGGMILARLAEPAQVIAAGSPVLTLGEIGSGVVARVGVRARDVRDIKPGGPALVRGSELGDSAIAGKVAAIAASGDIANGDFEIEIAFPNAAKAPPPGVVIIGLFPRESGKDIRPTGSFVVPPLAVFDARADHGFVYVVDANNITHRRVVTTGGLVRNGIIVLAGLAEGERVIAAGGAYVRDGQQVDPVGAPGILPEPNPPEPVKP